MSVTGAANPLVVPRRLAYVVDHSLPFSSDGYAVRTHEIARALGRHGHDVIVMNRPGRPWDLPAFPKTRRIQHDRTIDGVRYVFLPKFGTPVSGLREGLRAAERTLLQAFEAFRPSTVMAASAWENAEPAQYAARRWGVPFFFEQRGFWEMSRAAVDPDYAASEAYAIERDSDLRVARASAGVITLNEAMRSELVARGLSENKIHVVRNGARPVDAPSVPISRQAVGIKSKYLLGYVGSLNAYEGLDLLLEAVARLRKRRMDVALLIVGSGHSAGVITSVDDPAAQMITKQAKAHGVSEHVVHVPRVPQDGVVGYYKILDAMVMPRLRSPMSEIVSPIKPYAAAAAGIPVVLSDLPPLREAAEDLGAAVFPVGDVVALTERLASILATSNRAPPVLSRDVDWSVRVKPLLRVLRAAAPAPRPAVSSAAAVTAPQAPRSHPRFDIFNLPQVVFPTDDAILRTVLIGPGVGLHGPRVAQTTRATLLGDLATGEPGRFVIDWAGLQRTSGEWDGLWSIDNMRLNRQVLDATRIGQTRGWQMHVLGPVSRSKAPLFRIVAAAFEEVPG